VLETLPCAVLALVGVVLAARSVQKESAHFAWKALAACVLPTVSILGIHANQALLTQRVLQKSSGLLVGLVPMMMMGLNFVGGLIFSQWLMFVFETTTDPNANVVPNVMAMPGGLLMPSAVYTFVIAQACISAANDSEIITTVNVPRANAALLIALALLTLVNLAIEFFEEARRTSKAEPAHADTTLELRRVTKTFPGFCCCKREVTALANLTVRVRARDGIVGLLGKVRTMRFQKEHHSLDCSHSWRRMAPARRRHRRC